VDGDAGVVRRVFGGDLMAGTTQQSGQAKLESRSIVVGGFLQTVSRSRAARGRLVTEDPRHRIGGDENLSAAIRGRRGTY
jgi:hypothetical protein